MKIAFDIKTFIPLARRNFSLVLWISLAMVLIIELFVIKGALALVLYARNTNSAVQAQIVRVNFEQYNLIEKRLEANRQFVAEEPRHESPFGIAPAE